ncbi:MAG: 3-isopropylmalate dehydratase small subunit [Acidobacteriota bacterium]|jgi:3-isopropylmalate/(R)-2-methylmalate dehydratase small subunit
MNFASRVVPLPDENVDTDQIIPARFLKTTIKNGLGKMLLYDWRYDASGNPKPDFILNRPENQGAKVLLAGNNFGCGSSREHAPWALADFGFRILISTSFADIFRNNCLKNGILPIIVGKETHEKLFCFAAERPSAEVVVDLESQTLTLQNGDVVHFPIDPFSKKCLLEGVDELGYLVRLSHLIQQYETLNSKDNAENAEVLRYAQRSLR